MTINDWLTIIAIFLSPFLAVYVQSIIENNREKNNRKIWIFKTLMATRATPLDVNYVQALNMIDLEFSDKNKKEKNVIEAWKILINSFNEAPQEPSNPEQKASYDADMKIWVQSNTDKLVDLLYEMSKYFNYGFDKVHLKKGIYYPKGHSDIENEQKLMRLSFLQLVEGEKALKVKIDEET